MKSLASVAIWNLINEGQSNGGCLVVEARDDGTGNSSLGGSSIIRSNNVSTCWVVSWLSSTSVTEFRQPLQVQSHLEMPRILVQLGHTQRT